ncbi:uncharacterized protein LOC143027515 [Oratosquilla oratoria]|uniref:uncharacterized protein LOC143027515 n=1 Tax=Oratosquilla oratoria TaxID=337810 RepID=UPI003F773FFE
MQMLFHPEKCKIMHVGTNNPLYEYTMNGSDGSPHTLVSVEEERDLGVTVDQRLQFSSHIQAQVSKPNRVLGAIKHTFTAMVKTAFLHLYKSLVRPHLEYASVIWSPKLKRDKAALERVQRRATRLVTGLSHLSYSERLASLQLPTLQFRRHRADLIQAFKIMKNIDLIDYRRECNSCGRAMFNSTLSTATRGHNLKLQLQHQTSYRKTSYLQELQNHETS